MNTETLTSTTTNSTTKERNLPQPAHPERRTQREKRRARRIESAEHWRRLYGIPFPSPAPGAAAG